jgi:hypothetical protein
MSGWDAFLFTQFEIHVQNPRIYFRLIPKAELSERETALLDKEVLGAEKKRLSV